jgi:hypothetical protein
MVVLVEEWRHRYDKSRLLHHREYRLVHDLQPIREVAV